MIGHLQRIIGNQFIILKSCKGKESSVFPVFSMWTEHIGNQVVAEGENRFYKYIPINKWKRNYKIKESPFYNLPPTE